MSLIANLRSMSYDHDSFLHCMREEVMKRKLNRRAFLATSASAAAVAPAVGLFAPHVALAADKITVGMAWPGMQDAVWSTSHKLLNEYSAASDTEIELVFTAADMDVAKQSSDVNDLISRGVDIVLVFPIDSMAISSSVKRARDAGIPSMSFLRQVHADAGCNSRIATEFARFGLKPMFSGHHALIRLSNSPVSGRDHGKMQETTK